MSRNHSIYWYDEGPEFRSAFLFNLRDADVRSGGSIPKGAITDGQVGLVAAEDEVVGKSAKIVSFNPNRRCKWQGFELPCMVSKTLPGGRVTGPLLRRSNFAVAAITCPEVEETARSLKVPCVTTPEGVLVINVELARFERQKNRGRRATLI